MPTMAVDAVRLASSPVEPLGQAEVGDVRLGPDVSSRMLRRLEVPVEDAALVGMMHRPGDDRQQLGRGPGVAGNRAATGRRGCRPRSASW